jgi:uncharacterized protein (DUF1810 family)
MNSLDRFISVQQYVYDEALKEIKDGEKKSHWMWFIFPQIIGLGESDNAIYYSIVNAEEASDYLNHEILGKRLREITSELLKLKTNDPEKIFGEIDSMKLKSSMTLFDYIENNSIFESVLNKYFNGKRDELTLDKLAKQKYISGR